MKATTTDPKGFTLVEMLVAMAAGLIVMIAIYTAYVNHQRSHVTQQLVVDMQQNARAAMSLMKREIRMLGYDPAATDGVDNDANSAIDDETSGAGMINAEIDNIQFTADFAYDWDLDDANENITYTLSGTQLQRQDGAGTPQVIAYDIEAVSFAYAVDEDLDGELDLSPNNYIQWFFDSNDGDMALDQIVDTNDDGVVDVNDTEGGVNSGVPQVPLDRIRAVRIWLLARTRQPLKGQTDNDTYAVGAIHRGPADGDWDSRRKRVLLTTTVYCRNMGI